jgi:hypothetical protein
MPNLSTVVQLKYSNKFFLTAIVGDITPSDGIPKAEKSRREQAALDEMCEVLGGGPIGLCRFFVLNVHVKISISKKNQ